MLHRQYAQAAEKNVQTDYVCSGAQGAPCKLQVWWHYRRPHPPCRGAACRSRRCTGAINKLPLKWQILPICHCEEAIAFLTLARTSRRCGVGRGMPLPYSALREAMGKTPLSTLNFRRPAGGYPRTGISSNPGRAPMPRRGSDCSRPDCAPRPPRATARCPAAGSARPTGHNTSRFP